MKESHMYAHTEPQHEIMQLLIMGVVRRDGEYLMNAFMFSGEISEMHVDQAKSYISQICLSKDCARLLL